MSGRKYMKGAGWVAECVLDKPEPKEAGKGKRTTVVGPSKIFAGDDGSLSERRPPSILCGPRAYGEGVGDGPDYQDALWTERAAQLAGGERAPARPYVSIQGHNNPPKKSKVASSRSKSAYKWRIEMEEFIRKWGIDYVGFLTLGFADPQPDADEAEKRFNSAMNNYLRSEFLGYIAVLERGEQNGNLHFHLLVALPFPIRPGFTFEALGLKKVRGTNACRELKSLWRRMRRKLPAYGFGGFPQLIPIRKSATAAAIYLAGYMTKTLKCRHSDDVGRRLIRTSRDVVRHATERFSWNSFGCWLYREKLRLFAFKNGYYSLGELHRWMGHDVQYRCRDDILLQVIPVFRSFADYMRVHRASSGIAGFEILENGSVEVNFSNANRCLMGPFLPYHLRNSRTARSHSVLQNANPF